MTRDESDKIRRKKVVEAQRRRRVVLEMRAARARRKPVVSGDLKKMQDSLLKAVTPGQQQEPANPRAGMDRLLAVLDRKPAVDFNKFDPKTKPKKKQLRVIIDALGHGCEQCLARPAVIHNYDYGKHLCLSCEEMLILDTGAVAFERLSKLKKRTGGDR